jgi:hypothetical protein
MNVRFWRSKIHSFLLFRCEGHKFSFFDVSKIKRLHLEALPRNYHTVRDKTKLRAPSEIPLTKSKNEKIVDSVNLTSEFSDGEDYSFLEGVYIVNIY